MAARILTHHRHRPANTAAIPNRRPAERGDEFAPSKANAHLALPCEQWIKRVTARQLARRNRAGEIMTSCLPSTGCKWRARPKLGSGAKSLGR